MSSHNWYTLVEGRNYLFFQPVQTFFPPPPFGEDLLQGALQYKSIDTPQHFGGSSEYPHVLKQQLSGKYLNSEGTRNSFPLADDLVKHTFCLLNKISLGARKKKKVKAATQEVQASISTAFY